eukprot:g13193.t1
MSDFGCDNTVVSISVLCGRGINYNFVVGGYLACSVIFGVLLCLDKQFHVEAVEGSWVVFAPFLPCLWWALAMRSKWLSTTGSGGDDTEAKKDD